NTLVLFCSAIMRSKGFPRARQAVMASRLAHSARTLSPNTPDELAIAERSRARVCEYTVESVCASARSNHSIASLRGPRKLQKQYSHSTSCMPVSRFSAEYPGADAWRLQVRAACRLSYSVSILFTHALGTVTRVNCNGV